MIDFTVAICTYNGETRLPKVLKRLVSQIKTDHFAWEILIIDNNSIDNTSKIVEEYQSHPGAYPIRYYFEPKQGIAFARRRAIQESKGEYVGFLDDDNLPTPDWVSAAYNFGHSHPQAGAYGSQIYGDYEVKPPENFKRIACFLAIIQRGQEPFCYQPRQGLFPVGAGLVIRKQAWLNNVPEQPWLKGVCATSLSAKGEDIETLSYIQKAGWEIWHNPQMCIEHQIPKWRLEKDYLLKLFRGVGLSRYPTRMLRFQHWQKPVMMLVYLINDFGKTILHLIKYRQHLKTDLVAACELELFVNSLFSPFYHWIFGNQS